MAAPFLGGMVHGQGFDQWFGCKFQGEEQQTNCFCWHHYYFSMLGNFVRIMRPILAPSSSLSQVWQAIRTNLVV